MNKERPLETALALGFIVLGAAALYYTKDMTRLGSVFPRAIGSVLILLSTAHLILRFVQPPDTAVAADRGSWLRRVALAAVISIWALALNKVGFLTTSACAFAALIVIANFETWTPKRTAVVGFSAFITLGGLYSVFRFGLQVPLPTGIFI